MLFAICQEYLALYFKIFMNIHKMPRKLQVCREKDKTVSKNGGIVARLGFFMYLCKVTALHLIIIYASAGRPASGRCMAVAKGKSILWTTK